MINLEWLLSAAICLLIRRLFLFLQRLFPTLPVLLRPSSTVSPSFSVSICSSSSSFFFPSLQAALPLPSLFRIPHLLLLLQRFVTMMSVSRLSFNQMFDRFCLRKLKNEVKPCSIFDTDTDYHALFLFHR